MVINEDEESWRVVVRSQQYQRIQTYVIHEGSKKYTQSEAALSCALKNGHLPSVSTDEDMEFLYKRVLYKGHPIWLKDIGGLTTKECGDVSTFGLKKQPRNFEQLEISRALSHEAGLMSKVCNCLARTCCGLTVVKSAESSYTIDTQDCKSNQSLVCVISGHIFDQPYSKPFLVFNDDMHSWTLKNVSRWQRRMSPITRTQEQVGLLVMVICFACLIFAILTRYNQKRSSRRPFTAINATDPLPASLSWRNNSAHVTLSHAPRTSRYRNSQQIILDIPNEEVSPLPGSMSNIREDDPPAYDEVVKQQR
jgi:hypothetical protein